jgi:hypothetical protein
MCEPSPDVIEKIRAVLQDLSLMETQ